MPTNPTAPFTHLALRDFWVNFLWPQRPRPEMPFIVEGYNEIHKERLKVLPGITGLWQLSGDRKKPIHENMDYDLYYIRNVSFFLDAAILTETMIFALRGI